MRRSQSTPKRSNDAAATPPPVEQAAQPVAWGQIGMLNGHAYLRMAYDRTPYPPPADVVRNLNLVPLYLHPQRGSEPLTEWSATALNSLMNAVRCHGSDKTNAEILADRGIRSSSNGGGV